MEEKECYFSKRGLRNILFDLLFQDLLMFLLIFILFITTSLSNYFILFLFILKLYDLVKVIIRFNKIKCLEIAPFRLTEEGFESPFIMEFVYWSEIKELKFRSKFGKKKLLIECDFIVYDYETENQLDFLNFYETEIKLNLSYLQGNEEKIFKEIKWMFENCRN